MDKCDWEAELCRREREECGECVWCGVLPGEPCGSDASIPGCVIDGVRQLEAEDE